VFSGVLGYRCVSACNQTDLTLVTYHFGKRL